MMELSVVVQAYAPILSVAQTSPEMPFQCGVPPSSQKISPLLAHSLETAIAVA